MLWRSSPAAGAQPQPPSDRPTLTNITAQFHPGPYNAMVVDQRDSRRVAVVTRDGHVMWSHDGGYRVDDAQAAQARTLDPITLRGTGGGRAILSDSRGDNASPDREMSSYLLMHNMQNGIPPVRWFAWMGVPQFFPQFSNIALPAGDGPMFLAGAGGIYGSDASRRTWKRIHGPSNFYPSDKDEWGIAVTVNPNNPKHILASTDRGLMISRNGGATFSHPRVQTMQDLVINQFLWTSDTQLYIAAYGELMVSNDAGESFESITAIDGDINQMAVVGGMLYLATTDGAWIAPIPAKEGEAAPPADPEAPPAPEPLHILTERNVVGIVPWQGGGVLLATTDELLLRTAAGKEITLFGTSGKDPIVSLQGNAERAWMLTQGAIFSLGAPVPRKPGTPTKPPRLRIDLPTLERQTIAYYKIYPPKRLGGTEYLPTLEVEVGNHSTSRYMVMNDPTFPVSFRQLADDGTSRVQWKVMIEWDFSHILFSKWGKRSNNAFSMIDTGIRDQRERC
ncbi:MAG: hypothetical protein IPL79_08890 [Myxococcales bacterium]|nr:hypothetical protein [Myxococcales bacterium]